MTIDIDISFKNLKNFKNLLEKNELNIDIFKNVLIDIVFFPECPNRIDIGINIFRDGLINIYIDINIFKNGLININIDIDIFKKC